MTAVSWPAGAPQRLRARRLGIDTYQQAVLFMHRDCPVCRAQGFEAQSRVEVVVAGRAILATVNVVHGDLLPPGEAGLSEFAWRELGAREGQMVEVRHAEPLESLSLLRAKVYGRTLQPGDMQCIVRDIAAGRYSDLHLAAFVTACAGGRLGYEELVGLTRAMVAAGERLNWARSPILDKHSVGGLPGNRTSPIVVAIVAACGLIIPKTSSRAITSPAGTADVMETLAPVDLDLPAMRRVVEREGGCIVWGGAMRLSPADDVLIRVARPLDFDSEAQLVASVLSKKAAAGSTHVLVDIPVGPTAKVRSEAAGDALGGVLTRVGEAVGVEVKPVLSDGSQPVGRGIGPALEARDVLAVLRGAEDAPADLRERALGLAAAVLDMAPHGRLVPGRESASLALESGAALKKFEAICRAQGALREPPVAPITHVVTPAAAGTVAAIDNRRLARLAKLSGAPAAKAAGVELHVSVGSRVEQDQPLLTLHSQTPGERDYALGYLARHPDMIAVAEAV